MVSNLGMVVVIALSVSCGSVSGGQEVSLVVVTVEPAGVNCASGGNRIDTGIDTNHDGTLQPDEIDHTTYACNLPSTALTLTSAEPPGANCVGGGTRIDVGIDDGAGGGIPGDGMLQTGEIDSTTYACVDQWAGAGAKWAVEGVAYGRFTWTQAGVTNTGRANGTAFCTARGGTLARPNSQAAWDKIHDNLAADSTGWWIDGSNNFICGIATSNSPKAYEFGFMYAPTGTAGLYTGCNCTATEAGLVIYNFSGSSTFDGCMGMSTVTGALGAMDETLVYNNAGINGFICAR